MSVFQQGHFLFSSGELYFAVLAFATRSRVNVPRAFTLIELLIVLAIIAIPAAIAVPNFLEAQTRAKVSRAQADLRTLQVSLESYRVDNNDYPYILDLDVGEYVMPTGFPPGRTGPGGLTFP